MWLPAAPGQNILQRAHRDVVFSEAAVDSWLLCKAPRPLFKEEIMIKRLDLYRQLGVAQAILLCLCAQPVKAEEDVSTTGSVTSKRVTVESQPATGGSGERATGTGEFTIEQSGVMGVRSANVFRPKYRERLKTYSEQIEMGVAKGWLTSEEGQHFKKEHARLDALEAEVSSHGFPKAELDNLERQFTQFNIDLHKASNKPASAAATGAPTQAAAGQAKPTVASPSVPAGNADAKKPAAPAAVTPGAGANPASIKSPAKPIRDKH